MLIRLKRCLYRIKLRAKGAQLKHPVIGFDYLFGNVMGFQSGVNVWLESGVKLNIGFKGILRIGDFVYINSYTIIDCQNSITIGSRVQIGPHCYIGDFDHGVHVNVQHPFDHRYPKDLAPVVIEDNVWLGAGSIVLKGVTIGKNSVIAAGSVVNRDIPPNCVAGGVPAKKLRIIEGNVD
jgi:acetyltransferase-like isoleucine patch superfamily enzyme